MLQVALARVLDRRRERFLASGIWRCVLGDAPLARLDDKCRALHGLSASSGAIRLPHNRYVLGSFSFPDSLHLREHLGARHNRYGCYCPIQRSNLRLDAHVCPFYRYHRLPRHVLGSQTPVQRHSRGLTAKHWR